MKLEEIYLSEKDTDMLSDILEVYNKDLPFSEKKTYQQIAEDLLSDAIMQQYLKIKYKQ